MFKESLWSLVLVVLVEAVSAVVGYLRDRLMSHIGRDQVFGHDAYAS